MTSWFSFGLFFGRPQRSPTFGPPEQSCHGKFRKIGNSRAETFLWFVPEVAASRKFRSPHVLQRKSFSLPISVICTGVVPCHEKSFLRLHFLIFWFSDFDFWSGCKEKARKEESGAPPSYFGGRTWDSLWSHFWRTLNFVGFRGFEVVNMRAQCHTIAVTPVTLDGVAHTISQSAIFEMSWKGSCFTPQPSQERPCLTLLATPCQRCRGSISKRKRIVLYGGVAATLSRVAFHCATKSGSSKSAQ